MQKPAESLRNAANIVKLFISQPLQTTQGTMTQNYLQYERHYRNSSSKSFLNRVSCYIITHLSPHERCAFPRFHMKKLCITPMGSKTIRFKIISIKNRWVSQNKIFLLEKNRMVDKLDTTDQKANIHGSKHILRTTKPNFHVHQGYSH